MWVYGFLFASRDPAYRIDDDAWRASAEQVCAAAEEERLQLIDVEDGYIANPTPEQMRQRADIVDRATDILEHELEQLLALPLATQRDRDLLAEYAGFYRTLLADRRAYTAELRAGVLEPYSETAVEGGPVTNVILDFTTMNGIKSCAPPGELGGDN